MNRALLLLLLCVLASSCFAPVADIECNVDADCAPWMVCSNEGRCVDPASDAQRADAGRDAGATVDAGPPVLVGDGGVNWGNVATDLRGVELGSGRAQNAALSRPVTVSLRGDARFQIVNAQLNRFSAGDETGQLVVRVKNVGVTGGCFVKTESIVYTGSDGVVHVGSFTYLFGSNATLTVNNRSTDSCLLPGEEGFLVDIILDRDVPSFFSKTTGVRLELMTADFEFAPSPRFVPHAYSFTPRNSFTTLSIEALNTTGVGLRFDGLVFGLVIPLDEGGRGLTFSFLSGVSDNEVRVRSGEAVTLSDDYFGFDGSTSWVYARTGDFDACSGCLRAPWNLATREGQRAFLRARNEAELARETE